MALQLADRVQEASTTSGTGTLTLTGALPGFQTFLAGVGSGNTTFYTIYDPITFEWEVGIGTVGAGTLSRDTVLSNSLGSTAKISFVGNQVNVFATYPAEKSVNLDATGNVGPLGTINSGTWQGSTIGVGYGGTGVTASSGANSVVLRDADQNITANSVTQNLAKITSAAGTTNLTTASSHFQVLTGTTTQTFKLPDATSLPLGSTWVFDNDSTGNLFITDNANGSIDTVPSGGYATVVLESNGTVAGEWLRYGMLPNEVNWGTNSLDLGGSTVITNGTWQGTTIAYNYGGTGLTSFGAANYALYSTSASALTAGTLPPAAGGTGQTTYTDGELLIGKTTGNTLAKATLTQGTGISITNGSGAITITNSAPDRTVTLTNGTGISISGTYPSFTITNTSPSSGGTVTSVSALTLGTTGTDLSSTVANSTTTPVITLNVPTASASNRGALSSTDWSTFNGKQTAYTILTTFGSLANGAGWLYNNGSGTLSYTTPTKSDVGLGNVTNDAQTKAAIVPNTAPTSGQILVGNAGGTAYAPVSASGDATLASTGVLTLATVNSNVGSFTYASVTVNAKGLVTAVSSGSSPVGKQTIWVPAGAMIPRTTNGPAYAVTQLATNGTLISALAFDPTTAEYAQFQIRMPKSWNESTVTFTSVWTANSTSTNGVAWTMRAKALGNDETIDAAWGTDVTVTDNNTSTAYQNHITNESSALTVANASELEWVVFEVYRNVNDGGDTLAVDALLLGITINYTTDAANDA